MKKKCIFSLLLSATIFTVMNAPVFGATTSKISNEQSIEDITMQTNALKAQVAALEKEVKQLKQGQSSYQNISTNTPQVATRQGYRKNLSVSRTHINKQISIPQGSGVVAQTTMGESNNQTTSNLFHGLAGTPVVIAPYVGDHTAFDASDLIVTYSSYNEDLRLLQLRQGYYQQFAKQNASLFENPSLMLSGKIEGQAVYQKPYVGTHSNEIDLSGAELDFIPAFSEWAGGFVSLKYDNSQLNNTQLTKNSRIYVDRGFLTIGNLNKFPMYLTLGQVYAPFGIFSSNMITSPLTDAIFKIKARALIVGYNQSRKQGFYGQLFAFNGDSGTSTKDSINNGGANIGYTFNNNVWKADIGVAGIANVADASGMQDTSADSSVGFYGFTKPTGSNPNPEILVRQVPGLAVHANFGMGHVGFMGEYIKATSAFNPVNMMFNGYGAKPQAFNLEAYYNFQWCDKPAAITLGYGGTRQALALNVPKQRYIATFNTSIWKNTIESIEFRHDANYDNGDVASGAKTAVAIPGMGGSSNTITAQLGVYF